MFVSVWHSNHNKSFTVVCVETICFHPVLFLISIRYMAKLNSPRWGELWLVPWLVMIERSVLQYRMLRWTSRTLVSAHQIAFLKHLHKSEKLVRSLFFASYLEEKSHFNWVSGIRLKNVNKCYLWRRGVRLSRLLIGTHQFNNNVLTNKSHHKGYVVVWMHGLSYSVRIV